MNETLGFMVAVFVVLAIAARHLIRENRELKAENRNLRSEMRQAQGWYLAMKQRNAWLQSELGATEDEAEQEAER